MNNKDEKKTHTRNLLLLFLFIFFEIENFKFQMLYVLLLGHVINYTHIVIISPDLIFYIHFC